MNEETELIPLMITPRELVELIVAGRELRDMIGNANSLERALESISERFDSQR